MHTSSGQSSTEPSVMQLMVDQFEELIVTIIDEVRQRPSVAVAILAGVAGAVVGSMLASRAGRGHASPAARAVKKARGVGEAADLVALGLRLMQNPLVRRFLVSALEGQVKKRLSRSL